MDNVNYTTMGVLGTVITGSGFSADCKPGTLLAVAPDGTYVPAQAKWSGTVGRNGCGIPALSSYVIGVLISDVVSGVGSILCDGVITDPDLIAVLVPNSPTDDVGAYYLSETAPGKADRGPLSENSNSIATYCFTHRRESGTPAPLDKTSNSLTRSIIFRPAVPEYAGHSHHCEELTGSWIYREDSTGNFTSSLLVSQDSSAGILLSLSGSSVVLLQNGTQLPADCWSYTVEDSGDYTITLQHLRVIAEDRFTLCGTTPFTAREPVVRGLRYGHNAEGLFKFSGLYGQLEMSLNTKSIDTDQYTGQAVLDLNDEGMKTGPVVQELVAGPGIALVGKTPGSFVISSTGVGKSYIDMQVCNLDGVILGSDDTFTSFVFPKEAVSQLYGTIRAPHYDGESLKGSIRLLVRGGNSGGSLSVRYRVLTPPDITSTDATSAGVVIPTAASLATLDTSRYGTNENCAYLLTSESLEIASDSLILCQIVANRPTTSVEVFSASLVLELL